MQKRLSASSLFFLSITIRFLEKVFTLVFSVDEGLFLKNGY